MNFQDSDRIGAIVGGEEKNDKHKYQERVSNARHKAMPANVPAEYPSSSNIPFPFPTGPYEQQAALMDTILQSLQLLDREVRVGGEIDNDIRGDRDLARSRQAHVMMLESPTGTGKSLSLACASLAWLKYKEQVDLAEMAENEVNKSTSANTSTNVNANANANAKVEDKAETCTSVEQKEYNSISWLDAWAPPEQLEREKKMQEEKRDCGLRASSTRQALEEELNLIRRRIRNEVQINSNVSKLGEEKAKRQVHASLRNARDNVAKVAIDRIGKNNRKNIMKESRTLVGKKRARNSVLKNDDDFCLDEYNSDNDENHGISGKARSYHYESSDDDDDLDKDADADANANKLDQKKLGHRKNKHSTNSILDGGQLDGSGFAPHQNKIARFQSFNSDDKNNNHPQVSIGGVKPGSGVRKIVYAARTHSQLSQFVGEIRRTAWGDKIRVMTLGGRKLLCSNTEVTGNTNRRSEAYITEKCLDMQKGISSTNSNDNDRNNPDGRSTKKSTKSCPLLTKDLLPTLSLHMLAKPSDIEDLASLGKKTKLCSYYASRGSLNAAEVVVVPYNTLLSKSARDAVGLSLKNSLVIVDEAHNIPEALRSLSSSQLTLTIIERASAQLTEYVGKYLDRLAGRNLDYLGKIRKFLMQAAKHLKLTRRKDGSKRIMITATELLFTLKLDNLNLYSIISYLEKSRLSQKLHGFNSALQRAKAQGSDAQVDDPEFVSKHISAMSIVETFMKCLTSTQKEGRVIIDSRTSNEVPCFRYLLLDPSSEFKNVLNEAHAVVLAGGTLRPFSHVATELFGSNQKFVKQAKTADNASKSEGGRTSSGTMSTSLSTFSCGHVVPSNNVFMTSLPKGPNGVSLDFRHSSRFQDKICTELGESILKLTNVVPNGMVVFFPSYSYEAFVVKSWKASGVYDKIKVQKKLFREPQSAREVETILASYSKQASSDTGAILFCVVGGKMSEGINFANEMARCIFIVGIPYPDITDPELKEKMRLLDKEQRENPETSSGISGRDYYHNLCMRAVNQSVGRAIRHAKDFAAIILADARYATDPRVWRGLPDWLRSDTKQCSRPFHESVRDIENFFRDTVVSL